MYLWAAVYFVPPITGTCTNAPGFLLSSRIVGTNCSDVAVYRCYPHLPRTLGSGTRPFFPLPASHGARCVLLLLLEIPPFPPHPLHHCFHSWAIIHLRLTLLLSAQPESRRSEDTYARYLPAGNAQHRTGAKVNTNRIKRL